jgi:hypothetical protein
MVNAHNMRADLPTHDQAADEATAGVSFSTDQRAAYDLLVNDGYPAEKATALVTAYAQAGQDVEDAARVLIEQRRVRRHILNRRGN